MKLLLDTHSFLWFIGGDERLSSTARTLSENVNNDVFLSVASLWEMAIKTGWVGSDWHNPLSPLFRSKSV
jgi:PIN domain nuclease of toxin-antitoxin system